MNFFTDAYKHYADFNGRANREKYWMFYLFYIIFYVGLLIIDGFLGTGGLLAGLFALGSFVPSIAIGARRLHDIGKSGWWQLLVLIPLIGAIILLIWFVLKGTDGDNQFGPDPLH